MLLKGRDLGRFRRGLAADHGSDGRASHDAHRAGRSPDRCTHCAGSRRSEPCTDGMCTRFAGNRVKMAVFVRGRWIVGVVHLWELVKCCGCLMVPCIKASFPADAPIAYKKPPSRRPQVYAGGSPARLPRDNHYPTGESPGSTAERRAERRGKFACLRDLLTAVRKATCRRWVRGSGA